MGLDLSTTDFNRWLKSQFKSSEKRNRFLKRLSAHVGQPISASQFASRTERSERVGSYTCYGIFYILLEYLTIPNCDTSFSQDEDIETAALEQFKRAFPKGTSLIRHSEHFTRTGDTDTIFLPIPFDSPLEFEEAFVGSLPMALDALRQLSKVLDFNLASEYEEELIEGGYSYVAIARNVARVLYRFFGKNSRTCIAYS